MACILLALRSQVETELRFKLYLEKKIIQTYTNVNWLRFAHDKKVFETMQTTLLYFDRTSAIE